jgi:hypothetical protein
MKEKILRNQNIFVFPFGQFDLKQFQHLVFEISTQIYPDLVSKNLKIQSS